MQKATKIPSENLPRFFLTANTIFYPKFSSPAFKSCWATNAWTRRPISTVSIFFPFSSLIFYIFPLLTFLNRNLFLCNHCVSFDTRKARFFSFLDKHVQLFANFKRILPISFHFASGCSKSGFLLQTRLSLRGLFDCFSGCKD